jgi:hypothetical protein
MSIDDEIQRRLGSSDDAWDQHVALKPLLDSVQGTDRIAVLRALGELVPDMNEQPDVAVAYFREAHELGDGDALARCEELLSEMGAVAELTNLQFERGTSFDPEDRSSENLHHLVLLARAVEFGDPTAAEPLWRDVLALDPGHPEALEYFADRTA